MGRCQESQGRPRRLHEPEHARRQSTVRAQARAGTKHRASPNTARPRTQREPKHFAGRAQRGPRARARPRTATTTGRRRVSAPAWSPAECASATTSSSFWAAVAASPAECAALAAAISASTSAAPGAPAPAPLYQGHFISPRGLRTGRFASHAWWMCAKCAWLCVASVGNG